MATFYFLDTNIILGYCNFLDRIHLISKDLVDALNYSWSKNIILLFSVEKEFNLKLQKDMNRFQNKLMSYLSSNINKLSEIKESWGKRENLDKYIFSLFEERKIDQITYTNSMKISLEYYKQLSHVFDTLTKDWIKRPLADEYDFIKTTRIYNQNKIKTSNLFHYPDSEHILLAIYEALNNLSHIYKFYTSDGGWNGKNEALRISNLQIILKLQRTIYIGGKPSSEYSSNAFLLLNEGYTCVLAGMGHRISKVVSIALFLKDRLIKTSRIIKVVLGSKIKDNHRTSTMDLYISNNNE